MVYLLSISFVLHLITIFVIVILMQRISNSSKSMSANEQDKLKQEIEDLLVAYTTEMQEDNKKLLKKFTTLKSNTVHDRATSQQSSYEKPALKPDLSKKINPIKPQNKVEEDLLPPITEVQDTVDYSPRAQIFLMAKNGYSATEIAKKLDMGAGEVELLLKMQK